jgi:hypothetical protein
VAGGSPSNRDPALPIDPWVEQATRRDAAARRHRIRWMLGAGAAASILAAVTLAYLARDGAGQDHDDAVASTTPASDDVVLPPTPASSDVVTVASTDEKLENASLVRLDEVWLLDRLDGTFQWGVTVQSTAADDRGPITIGASLRDGDRAEVGRVDETIDELAAGARVTIGGVVDDLDGEPKRLVVDVMVGEPMTDPAMAPDDLRILAVERRRTAGGGGDVVVGRIRSGAGTDVAGIRLVLLWRDEGGDVVAAVFHDVERVRSGVDARFEIPVGHLVGADGPPGEVTWSH